MALDPRQHIPDTMNDSAIIFSCTGNHIFPAILVFKSGCDKQEHALSIASHDTVELEENSIHVSGITIAYHDIPHAIYVSHATYLQLAILGCPPLEDMKSIQSSPLWLHDFPMSQEDIDFFLSRESDQWP